jgi:hypothetical protein
MTGHWHGREVVLDRRIAQYHRGVSEGEAGSPHGARAVIRYLNCGSLTAAGAELTVGLTLLALNSLGSNGLVDLFVDHRVSTKIRSESRFSDGTSR